jgi:hypothetical protein
MYSWCGRLLVLQIKLQTTGLDRLVAGALALTDQQLKWAVADAMTAASAHAKAELQRQTPLYVDRPSRYTMGSIYRWPGYVKPQNLSVQIGFKDLEGSNMGSTDHYLLPMARGTTRPVRRGEHRLRSLPGFAGMYYIPTKYENNGLRYNKDGNLTAGTYTRVLSRIKAFNLAGFNANRAASGRSAFKAGKADFFAATLKTGKGKMPGIYFRIGGAKKRGFHTAFYLTDKAPKYRPTFPVSNILRASFNSSYNPELIKNLTNKLQRMGL